jgi:HD-GYP domain-containing protein (c-di-GMP phosphodiesterase class II)
MQEKDETRFREKAKELINQLAIIIRNAYFHSLDNVAVQSAMDRLIELIDPVFAEDNLAKIELLGEYFYLNDTRVRYPVELMLNFDYLIREFRRRGLGSVTFSPGINKEHLKFFVKAFIDVAYLNTPFEAMVAKLEDVDTIDVGPLKHVSEEEGLDRRRIVKKTYFNAVSFTKGIITKLRAGEKVSIKKAKRVIESMVNMILEEEQLLLGMTAIKDYDEYTYHHSVNVSILSIAIGQKIGLQRRALTELGIVALFHDIGKMEIPKEILNKPTAFTDEEWKIIKRHPYWGFLTILKIKGIDNITMRSAIVAFEHHMHMNFSGYPKIKTQIPLDFYTKIVSIADQYDAMTSSRVYSRVPLQPDRALSIMMDRAGTQIDPVLFKFFVNMVGVYPVGSLVLLDTKEMGLVYECNPVHADRPRVMIIVDSSGKKIEGKVVDLTEKNENGRYLRTIVKTLDPNKYRINLSEYLL